MEGERQALSKKISKNAFMINYQLVVLTILITLTLNSMRN